MFKENHFKQQLSAIQADMQMCLRGNLDKKVETSVVAELVGIYQTMVDRYAQDVKSGSQFPAQPGVVDHPEEERVYYALSDLLERMELDFTQKFVKDFTHGLDQQVEIGKIKLSLLDRVQRSLQESKA